MGFLSFLFKPKIKVESEFWWEDNFTKLMLDSIESNKYLSEILFESLNIEEKVSYSIFTSEFDKLLLEVALIVQQNNSKEKSAILFNQGLYNFLIKNNRKDEWDSLINYNLNISDVFAMECHQKGELGGHIIMARNESKLKELESLMKSGHTPEVLSRVINRSDSVMLKKIKLLDGLVFYFIKNVNIDQKYRVTIYQFLCKYEERIKSYINGIEFI